MNGISLASLAQGIMSPGCQFNTCNEHVPGSAARKNRRSDTQLISLMHSCAARSGNCNRLPASPATSFGAGANLAWTALRGKTVERLAVPGTWPQHRQAFFLNLQADQQTMS